MINANSITGKRTPIFRTAFLWAPLGQPESGISAAFWDQRLAFLAGKQLPVSEASAQDYMNQTELGEAKFSRVTIEVVGIENSASQKSKYR